MRYKLSELPTSQTDISRNRQIKTANIQVTISIKQTVHPKYCIWVLLSIYKSLPGNDKYLTQKEPIHSLFMFIYTESLIDYKCTLVNVVYTAIHDMCSYRTNIIQASLNVQTMIISNKLKENSAENLETILLK